MTGYVLAPVTMETFLPLLGKTFNVLHCDVAVELKLTEVSDSTKGRPWPAKLPKPFLLIFSGPPERILMEGMRVLQTPGVDPFQLYVIPILTHDPGESGQLYQVIFN
ncbi:DUF6916 family protein [Arenibaculum sp.]|uniref:DUF6916 family protein n=1 Tax=Arenibaculum sp. TaxID=2865862 RepID=UPI002E10805A|nr:hypothetical protein [Arenibaculum sp.]